jgi:hypothetical protein
MQDASLVSGEDVCSEASQVGGRYVCLRQSGAQYHGTPAPGGGGAAPTRLRLATTRVTVAAAVPFGRWSVGARGGWAIAGHGPRPDGGDAFIPFHGEAQLAYWLTGKAFENRTVGVFVAGSVGFAQVDARSTVTVLEDPHTAPPAQQIDNPPSQRLDAYRRGGPGFGGAGLGAFLPIGATSGLLVDLRGIALFPTGGAAMSLGVSGVLGL